MGLSALLHPHTLARLGFLRNLKSERVLVWRRPLPIKGTAPVVGPRPDETSSRLRWRPLQTLAESVRHLSAEPDLAVRTEARSIIVENVEQCLQQACFLVSEDIIGLVGEDVHSAGLLADFRYKKVLLAS